MVVLDFSLVTMTIDKDKNRLQFGQGTSLTGTVSVNKSNSRDPDYFDRDHIIMNQFRWGLLNKIAMSRIWVTCWWFLASTPHHCKRVIGVIKEVMSLRWLTCHGRQNITHSGGGDADDDVDWPGNRNRVESALLSWPRKVIIIVE